MFNFFKKNFYINFFIVVTIFFVDRFTKLYVINFHKKNLGIDLLNSKFLNISLIWNEGIAFGLFSFDKELFYNILTLIIFLVILIIFFMIKNTYGLKKYALLMIFGGALGNFYDRIVFSAVPDFIDLHINNFHWFIFNVADIFITLGVIIMIMTEFFSKKVDK